MANRLVTRSFAALVCAMAALSPGLAQADDIGFDKALTAARTAMEKCASDGYRVSVAVVGRSGNTIVLIAADGAGPHTRGSSSGKAFTSASMGQPTKALAEMIRDKPELAGLRDMDPRLVFLAGGLPIRIDGSLIGGIGVGGAPGGHLDEACARAGLDAISAQ